MIVRIKEKYRQLFWPAERYAKYKGVKIGKNCSIMTKSFGSEPYLISIGDHVQITSGVRFFTHGGGWVFREKEPNFDCFGKIVVGNNVYIGNNVLVMPGVTVGNNVIIGAGSVVTKSIPDNSIAVGNPARVIKQVMELEKVLLKYNLNSKSMTYQQKKEFLLNIGEERFIQK